ncbi:MAG: selenide, water dikinase SelD [Pyrinomonadaceae bacterium]
MAKLAPGDLAQVLSKLPKQNNKNIIVGYENADDAGVFRLNNELSLVQTVDFFTPIADDPNLYGRIAAINSLSDVYAMGGKPLTALSIVCYPQKGDWSVLGEILQGGHSAMIDEGVAVLGGHSVDDQEMKFGYSVTGIVDTKHVITNSGAKPGDILFITKPIGTGVICTAIKFGKASAQAKESALYSMAESSKTASEAMVEARANACTDITGFGLLGHVFELAKASGVSLEIDSEKVPLMPEVIELISQKMLTRGDKNNRVYVGETIEIANNVSGEMQSALFDPQTSGGLLVSISPANSKVFAERYPKAKQIGVVSELADKLITVK